jgi:hypothetical protein
VFLRPIVVLTALTGHVLLSNTMENEKAQKPCLVEEERCWLCIKELGFKTDNKNNNDDQLLRFKRE